MKGTTDTYPKCALVWMQEAKEGGTPSLKLPRHC